MTIILKIYIHEYNIENNSYQPVINDFIRPAQSENLKFRIHTIPVRHQLIKCSNTEWKNSEHRIV